MDREEDYNYSVRECVIKARYVMHEGRYYNSFFFLSASFLALAAAASALAALSAALSAA